MTVYGIDRSHWNALPNFAQLAAAGIAFVFTKGTDGSGYLDPTMAATRSGAKAAGQVFGTYHFAEWGNVTTEATFYLAQVNPQPGELIALDCEAALPAGVDPVAWAVAWSKIVRARTGAWPLLYMNQSWATRYSWGPAVSLGDGLWLAKYDNVPTGAPLGAWPVLALKQFTDAATVPGQSGTVDEDAFQGDLSTLLRYTVPSPETDVNLTDELAFTNPDTGAVVQYDVGTWLAYANFYAGKAATEIQALAAKAPVTIDQAAADLIASSLVANPQFQTLITQAAQAVVAAMDADLAKKFGTS